MFQPCRLNHMHQCHPSLSPRKNSPRKNPSPFKTKAPDTPKTCRRSAPEQGLPRNAEPGSVLLYACVIGFTALIKPWATPACNNPVMAEIVNARSRSLIFAFDRCLEVGYAGGAEFQLCRGLACLSFDCCLEERAGACAWRRVVVWKRVLQTLVPSALPGHHAPPPYHT